jgi:prepilin-type N-terminal cleavage/methylation domain-containing protein
VNDTTIETPVATGGKDKGFTLVELLIVIVILGILATVTVFAVRGITDKGETARCDSDKKTVEVAVETWYAKDNRVDTDGNGEPSEAELVASAILREESVNYNVGANGTVTGVGACTPATTTPTTTA